MNAPGVREDRFNSAGQGEIVPAKLYVRRLRASASSRRWPRLLIRVLEHPVHAVDWPPCFAVILFAGQEVCFAPDPRPGIAFRRRAPRS